MAMDAVPPRVRVLGIRHHGPGSARAVVAALERQRPTAVLIEGPPEADALVQFAAGRTLRPPVALLAYVAHQPARSAFWPFAEFSPEWQALRWGVAHGAEVRFVDLPAATMLAEPAASEPDELPGDETEDAADEPGEAHVRTDPIAVLARTAGYDDPERWWDDVVEHQPDGNPFDAIAEAMALVRAGGRAQPASEQLFEARREAAMRTGVRRALRDNHERIAVVCGAWHAPALTAPPPAASADQKRLRGLPKAKVAITWVPWTHSRLSYHSGYGAGIDSPGWYHHLFTTRDAVVERWLTKVAGVLREHDLPVSASHVIEASRLAHTLAVLRERPIVGLDELQEATLAVLCDGSRGMLRVVTREVVVGEELGRVPKEAPSVPLDADLQASARSARLPMAPETKDYVLDLRREIDRAKSRLLRRMGILGVAWGQPMEVSGTGTFKEAWRVRWRPEFVVAVIEASLWGTTVAGAASAKLCSRTGTLIQVTAAIEEALLADLPDALPPLIRALDERAAHEADVLTLMSALPALARAARYGNVRGTDTSALTSVAVAMLTRIRAGLGSALGGVAPDQAVQIRALLIGLHQAVPLLPDPARDDWLQTLAEVGERADLPGGLAGRVIRLLLDADRIDRAEAATRLGRALSQGATAEQQAAWAEGFLGGGAALLIYDDALLRVVDEWVRGLTGEQFVAALPVVRRAFGSYTERERHAIADRVAGLGSASRPAASDEPELDEMPELLATLRLLLRGSAESSKEVSR